MKIRLSYTLLKLWEGKRYDDLIKFYFKTEELKTNRFMEEGSAWDKLVQESISKDNKLPEEFGGHTFGANVEAQKKIEASYNDQFDIVGVLDIYDPLVKEIIEIKTGSSMDAADYSNGLQIPIYFLLATLSSLPVEYATVIHFDQTTGKTTKAKIYYNEYQLSRAKEAIETSGKEILEYFTQQGLL